MNEILKYIAILAILIVIQILLRFELNELKISQWLNGVICVTVTMFLLCVFLGIITFK